MVSCFPVKHSSEGKVADSSARETGGKLSNKGSLHSTKQTPRGSNGIRAGPRRGRRAGSHLRRRPTPAPPGELQLCCALRSPRFRGGRENGYWEPTDRGPAGPARGSDGPTLLSFPSLSHSFGSGTRPGPRTHDPSRADTPTRPGPTHDTRTRPGPTHDTRTRPGPRTHDPSRADTRPVPGRHTTHGPVLGLHMTHRPVLGQHTTCPGPTHDTRTHPGPTYDPSRADT